MAEELGQPMVVTSTTGAAGVLAATTVLENPADGYTIFDGYVAPLVLSPLFDVADYTHEDFTPLYGVAANAFAVGSRPDEDRWSDLPSLLEYGRQNPGELRYSAGPEISLPNMIATAMLREAGVVARLVPYQDAGASWNDFAAGELDFMIMNAGTYAAQQDNVRVTAVLSDIPVGEGGIPGPLVTEYGIDIGVSGLAAMGWTWWVVKNGTPEERVEILREALYAALSDPEVAEEISSLGFTPLNPDDFRPEDYDETVSGIRDDLSAALDAIDWMRAELEALE
jgi:tripartite-type tricarboxylate transporter receptor subunit TctC